MKGESLYNEYDENQVTKLYKKKKKKKLKRKFKIFCFLLILILVIGYFVSDFSKVKSIQVIGNKDLNEKVITEASTITKDTTYLFIDKGKIEDLLKEQALIKKAEVSYDILGNVTIRVEESKKIAYCIIGKKTYVIDELGKVAQTNDENIIEDLKSCPKLSQFKDLKFLKTFAKEYAKVPELIKNQTSDIIYAPKNADETRVEFIMDNGKKLIVRVDDMADELSRFPIGYMDQYKNKCEFNFYGNNIYTTDCENTDKEVIEE